MTEIARYGRDNALAVVARIREDADLERLLDRLEILYRETMVAGRNRLTWSAHGRRTLRRFRQVLAATGSAGGGTLGTQSRPHRRLEASNRKTSPALCSVVAHRRCDRMVTTAPVACVKAPQMIRRLGRTRAHRC
jgi:hypothetical protein